MSETLQTSPLLARTSPPQYGSTKYPNYQQKTSFENPLFNQIFSKAATATIENNNEFEYQRTYDKPTGQMPEEINAHNQFDNIITNQPTDEVTDETRIFKKSHTCGSLFAKCHCGDNDRRGVLPRKHSSDGIHLEERCSNGRSNSLDSSLLRVEVNNNDIGNIETVQIAQICMDHPELCLKHPEFPFPIPPSRSKVKNKKSKESQISLSQILHSRDYVPTFPETFPRLSEAEVFFKESGIIGPAMGNGASAVAPVMNNNHIPADLSAIRKNSKILIDNAVAVKKRSSQFSEDSEYMKTIVPHLKKEGQQWEEKVNELDLEVIDLRQKLIQRDALILKLQREIHKLKVSEIN